MITTILVIDDNEDDRLLYRRAFRDFDRSFELVMAASAKDAFARIADSMRPDLILLDYTLPDMDGLSFMKLLDEQSDTAIPIIMLTGQDNAAVAVEAMKNGVDDYIVKDIEGRYLKRLPGVAGHVMAAHLQREQTRRLQKETDSLLLRNQTLMKNSMDGIHVMGMQGNIVEANDAFYQMLGYAPEEMARLNVADWDAQWSADELREIFKNIIGIHSRFETVHRRKDGTFMNVEISSSGMEIDGEHFLFAVSHDITKRKKAELTIRENENKFRLLFESASDGILILDFDGRIKDINRVGHERLGYTKEEMLGKPIAQFDPPDFAAKVDNRFAEIQDKGHATFESAHVRKDGSVMPVEINARAIELNGRQNFLSIIRDITERKKAEAELRRENESGHKRAKVLAQQFGHLLQGSFNEIYLFDAHTLRFLQVSEGAKINLGYSAEELEQLTPLDLKPLFTRESFEALLAPLRSGKQEMLVFETIHRRKDGSDYPVEVRFQLMDSESPVFLGIIQDISERKAAEEQLRFHSSMLKNLAEGILLVRASDGVIVFANPQFECMFGYESEELFGKHVSTINAPGKLSPEEVADAINKELESKDGWSGEVHNIRKDGTSFWCQASVSTFEHSRFGKVWVSVHEDISERKDAERLTRELSAHLQTVLEEEKASFAREIHDELGGTLAALKMDAYWLAGKLGERSELMPLQTCAQSMLGLLDNAVLSTRRIITDLRPTMLDDLGLLETLKWQSDQFHKRTGIECRVVFSGDAGREGKLDKTHSINLFRIFQESLTNIARHSGASRVEVELYHDNEETVLSISDNGRGLPEGYITAPTSYGMRGMHERAALLGGKMNFDSPPDGGFIVTVILPSQVGNKKAVS